MSDRQRQGRQRVTSRQQDRHIFLSHLRDRLRTSVQTAQKTVGINNQRISASTVKRRLRKRDIARYNAYRGNVLMPYVDETAITCVGNICDGNSVSGKV